MKRPHPERPSRSDLRAHISLLHRLLAACAVRNGGMLDFSAKELDSMDGVPAELVFGDGGVVVRVVEQGVVN